MSVGNENKKHKNRDRWNYCRHIIMLPLLGDNHCLSLLHMDKHFVWISKTKKRINEFDIGYIINPILRVNKAFGYQVEKFMNTTFGELTPLFIKATLSKIIQVF